MVCCDLAFGLCVYNFVVCGWYFGFGGLGGRVLVFGFWVGVLGLG